MTFRKFFAFILVSVVGAFYFAPVAWAMTISPSSYTYDLSVTASYDDCNNQNLSQPFSMGSYDTGHDYWVYGNFTNTGTNPPTPAGQYMRSWLFQAPNVDINTTFGGCDWLFMTDDSSNILAGTGTFHIFELQAGTNADNCGTTDTLANQETCLGSDFIADVGTFTVVTAQSAGQVAGAFIGIPSISEIISSTTPQAAGAYSGVSNVPFLVLGVIIAVLTVNLVIGLFAGATKKTLKVRR